VMQKMKEGFMGYTKTGTTAIKGMVGKIQRRMQNPNGPGYVPGYGPPGPGSGQQQPQPVSGGASRSGSGPFTAAEAFSRGSPSGRGGGKAEQ
jgi:hypothetical protein